MGPEQGGFNPEEEQFKKVEDLPEDQRENYVNVPQELGGKGFTTKEAMEELTDAEKIAEMANMERNEREPHPFNVLSRAIHGERSAQDVLHSEVLDRETALKDREAIFEKIKSALPGNVEKIINAMPKELYEDEEIMLEATESRPNVLELVPAEWRSNKAFMLKAVTRNAASLEYASPELKNDLDVVLEAMKDQPQALDLASPELQKRVKMILEKKKK